MSWHFLQEQEAASWAASSLDGAPSALLKLIPMHAANYSTGSVTGRCGSSLYGMTFRHSMDALGEVWSMSSAVDSPARTSATAGTKPAWLESAAASGETWPESLAKYDPDSSLWKTSQRSLFGGWETFLATWPRSGLMLDGMCWEAPTSGGLNLENECGSWPTLKASDAKQYSKNADYFRRRVKVAPDLPVLVGLKTPPTAAGFYGRLNPDWTEWLMGWPIGWTASGPLATDKFQSWLQQHGACFQREKSA